MAFEGDSKVVMFEGNFQDYEEDKKKRLGADAVNPHRIKYKKAAKLDLGSIFIGSNLKVLTEPVLYTEPDRCRFHWGPESQSVYLPMVHPGWQS